MQTQLVRTIGSPAPSIVASEWRACALGLVLIVCGDTAAWGRSKTVREALDKPHDWFASAEAAQMAESVLSYQAEQGGWPKNVDTGGGRFAGNRAELSPTFDNGATTDELRFLARMVRATGEDRYRAAFDKGFDYILRAQYPNGGWPQFFPPGKGYARHITFNDDAMVRLLEFLREVARSAPFDFVAPPRRVQAREAFERGIACILKCQVTVDGQLTAWCAQHDEVDFSPRGARTFELASLSGAETVGIVQMLMSLDQPRPEVVRSVEAAVRWLEAVKLTGIRVDVVRDPQSPKGTNKVVVVDPKAPPLWARFYEIGANRPLFADRDGVPRYALSEIGYERRNGYGWLTDRPAMLLEREYPAWRAKWGLK